MYPSKKNYPSGGHASSKLSSSKNMTFQNKPTQQQQSSVGLYANDFIGENSDKILLDPPRLSSYQQTSRSPFAKRDSPPTQSRNQTPSRNSARSSMALRSKYSPHESLLYQRDSPALSREVSPRSAKRSYRERPSLPDNGGYYRTFLKKLVGDSTGASRENTARSVSSIGLQFESFMNKVKGRKEEFISNVEFTTNRSLIAKPEVHTQPVKLEPAKNPLLNLSLDDIIKDNELFKSAIQTPESKHQTDFLTSTAATTYTGYTKRPQVSATRLVSDQVNDSMTRKGERTQRGLSLERKSDDIMIIPEIESEVMKLRKELILMEDVVIQRESEIAELRHKNEELQQKLQKEMSFDNKSELIRLRAEVEKYYNDKKQLAKELESSKSTIASLQQSVQAYESQMQEARVQASQNLIEKTEKEEDLKRQNEQLAMDIKKLQEINESLKKQLSEAQKSSQIQPQKSPQFQSQIQFVEQPKTNNESEKKLKEALDREEALKKQIDMMKQTIDGKIKEINLLKQVPKDGNAAQQELQKLKSEFSAVSQENDRNKLMIKDLRDQITSLEAKISESQTKINQLESLAKATPRKSDPMVEPQKQVTSLATTSGDNAEISKLKTENLKLQKDLSIIITRFEGMKKELVEAKEKIGKGLESQNQGAPQKVDELQKEIEEQQNQIIELSSRMMIMQSEKDELAKKFQDLLNDPRKVTEKEKAARADADKFKNEATKLTNSLRDMEKKFAALQRDSEKKLADTIKDQEKKLMNLQKDLEKKLTNAEKTILDLKNQIAKITAKDKVAATAEEFRVLSEKLNAELAALKEEHAKLLEENQQLAKDNSAMKTDLEQKSLIMTVPVTNEEMTEALVAKTKEILVLKEELQQLKGQ